MAVQYVDPKKAVHPLRLERTDEDIKEILKGIMNDEDWMSLEEIEAAQDYLYDYIAAEKQTHLGEVTLQ